MFHDRGKNIVTSLLHLCVPYKSSLVIVLTFYTLFEPMKSTCPASMVPKGKYCYEWNPKTLSEDLAFKRCGAQGGLSAWGHGDLLTNMNKMPFLDKFKRYKEGCTWGDHSDNPVFQDGIWLFNQENKLLKGLGFIILSAFLGTCTELCFKRNSWYATSARCEDPKPYVCKFEVSMFKNVHPPVTKMSSTKPRVARRVATSVRIIGTHVVDETVHTFTMCTRLCMSSAGCKVCNYHVIYRNCRCFGCEGPMSVIKAAPEWEFWDMG